MLYSRPIIELAPLQVYYSALILAPLRSRVRSQFKDQILQYAGEVPEGKQYWDVSLQTFEFSTILTFRQILGAKAIFFHQMIKC